MNWVDLAVIAVLGISAALAFVRGFARESLGVLAWVGAAYVSYALIEYVRLPVRNLVGNPEMGDIVAHASLFLAGLLVFTIVTGIIAQLVHSIGLGAVDRTFGVVFGLGRGAALTIAAYIGAGWVTAPDRWPEPVRNARLLPVVAEAANWTAEQIPPRYRPSVPMPPPQPPTRSLDLLQAVPLGRDPARP